MKNHDSNIQYFNVFVYGTLKKNGATHSLLENSIYLEDGSVKAEMYDNIYFPICIKSDKYIVKGEVYKVTKEVLDMLDMLENYPISYNREVIEVKTDNTVIKCYWYFQNKEEVCGLNKIKTGIWNNKQFMAI